MSQRPEALNGCKPPQYCAESSWLRKHYRTSRKKSNFISRIFFLMPLALIMGNISATILLIKASMANYPGSQALAIFHRSFLNSTHTLSILELLLDGILILRPTSHPHIQFSSSKQCLSLPSTSSLSSLPSTTLHFPRRMDLQ